jgi:hypothetical protein
MTLPDWTKTPEWETLVLGGKTVPGVAELTPTIPDGVDVQKPKGAKKATAVDNGDPPVEFDCTVTIWNAEQLNAFKVDIMPILKPRTKKGARSPLQIEHPMAALCDVTAVMVREVRFDPPRSGANLAVTIKLTEWTPGPSTVKATPKKPVDSTDGWEDYMPDRPRKSRPPERLYATGNPGLPAYLLRDEDKGKAQ